MRAAPTFRRSVIAALLIAGLGGCVSTARDGSGGGSALGAASGAGQDFSLSGAGIETGSIDPAYVTAVEDRAPNRPAGDEEAALTAVHAEAAKIAMAEGKTYGAVVHLSKLYEANPRDARVAYEFARHLRFVGALSEAERVLNDARAVHGAAPLLRLEYGKVMVAGGRYEEALRELEPLAAAHASDPGILQAYGVALDRSGRHREAQDVYETAMKQGRPTASLLTNMGLSKLLTGEPEEAISVLRRAVAAPGANQQTRNNLALALTLSGDPAAAREAASAGATGDGGQDAVDYFEGIAAAAHAWALLGEQ